MKGVFFMSKKHIKLLLIISCIAIIAVVICLIWLIGVCGVFFKEYTKTKQQNDTVLTEEKKALSEMLEGYDALTFNSFYYDSRQFCIFVYM